MSDLAGFEQYLRDRTRPNTAHTYLASVAAWLRWTNGMGVNQESAQEYLDYLKEEGKSQNTINVHANAIRRYFRFRGEKVVLEGPGMDFKSPVYITMEELEKLLEWCRTLLEETLIVVLFDTACRISEVLGIELDDVDWDNKLIKVERKGGRREWVIISDKALEVLKTWVDERPYKSQKVFGELSYPDALALIKNVGKRAGVRVTPHMFRHARAVQMLMAGAEPHVVQQALGHVDLETTMRIYARMMPVHLREKIPTW